MATIYNTLLLLTVASLPTARSITYNLTEEGGSNVRVGNVLQDSNIISGMAPEFVSSLEFKFLPSGYEFTRYFSISKPSGEIRTLLNLNRESVCGQEECLLRLMVGVQSSIERSFIKLISVFVRVLDINDNTPTFTPVSMTLNIPESVSVGTAYRIPAAEDNDLKRHGIVKYEIDRKSGQFFTVKYTQNMDNTFAVDIIVQHMLDREKAASHRIKLSAKDGGTPPKVGELMIYVNVTDTNDHAPTFSRAKYRVKYREDKPVNSVLLTVSALDADQGINARVYYFINRQMRQAIKDQFRVDESSGEIKLIKPMDYEQHHEYQFVVEAVDGGSQAHTSQALVVIQVENVNDNWPKIHTNLLRAVPEDSTQDHFIVLLSVTDADNLTENNVVCKIDTHLFKLTQARPHQYKLLLNTTLDREQMSFYDLVVSCVDGGSPPRLTHKDLRINVTDVNDNRPTFLPSKEFAYVTENCALNTYVVTINATDSDSGNNSKITYHLSNGAYPYFAMESDTGVIVTSHNIDREFRSKHTFLVIARDQGNPPLETTHEVIVIVKDLNDMAPYFAKDYIPFYFPENEKINAVVGKVMAIDNDLGDNRRLTYSILSQGETTPFVIDSSNGILYTADVYDREEQPEYRFKVAAVDSGRPRLTGTVNIAVFVSDVNDNDPVIVIPRNVTYKVSYKSEQGSKIFVVKAYDRDFGKNGKLRYSIAKGNEHGIVAIDGASGVVTTARELTADDKGEFAVLVEVTDGASPPRLSIATYTLAVVSELPSTDHLTIIIILSATTVCLASLILAVIFILRRRRNKHLERLNRLADTRENGDVLHGGVQLSDPSLMPYHKNCEVVRSHNGGTMSKLSRMDHQMSTLTSPPSFSSVYTVDQHNMQQVGSPTLVMNHTSPSNHAYHSPDHHPSRCSTPLHPSQYSCPPSHCALNHPTDPLQMKQINEMLQRLDAHSDTSGDSGRGTSDGDANSLQHADQRIYPNAIAKPPRSASRYSNVDAKSSWTYSQSESPSGHRDLTQRCVRFHPNLGAASTHNSSDDSLHENAQKQCHPGGGAYITGGHAPPHAYDKHYVAPSAQIRLTDSMNDAAFDGSSGYTDNDSDTTTSGSYTVDADQLVTDIDHMFFGECVV